MAILTRWNITWAKWHTDRAAESVDAGNYAAALANIRAARAMIDEGAPC